MPPPRPSGNAEVMARSGTVVGVLGASGGLGASTLTVALAGRAAARGLAPVVVDGHLEGGGLDVTAGQEHLAGLRWGDLAELRGAPGAAALLAALPSAVGVALLAAGRGAAAVRPVVPDAAVIEAVDALRGESDLLLVDLCRRPALRDGLVARCDTVLLLTGLHVRALADVDALVEALLDAAADPPADVRLVTRGPRASAHLAESVEQHLGLPHLAHVVDDDRVPRAAERGSWPGERHTALAECADRILGAVLTAPLGLVS